MKKYIVFLLILLLLPVASLGEGGAFAGMGVADRYEAGKDLFSLEEYAQAAEYFEAAGNFRDAKKWTYYCQAITSVLACSNQDASGMNSARARFELLAAQSFEQAAQWAQYCKARAYESSAMTSDAQALYATIAVHDSIERYLSCMKKANVLESAESVRSRMAGSVSGSAEEHYQAGMDLFYLEDYAQAADHFCLAGNFQDARMWRCYCQAIALVTQENRLEDSYVLFELLAAQGFEAAVPWQTYCEARSYEELSFAAQAMEMYKTIFVYDSSERYLKLAGY